MIPVGTRIELHGVDFLRERRIQGCMMGSNRFRTDMPRLIEFYLQGRLHLAEMVSARIGLAQINDGFAALKAGGVARNVIVFEQASAQRRRRVAGIRAGPTHALRSNSTWTKSPR